MARHRISWAHTLPEPQEHHVFRINGVSVQILKGRIARQLLRRGPPEECLTHAEIQHPEEVFLNLLMVLVLARHQHDSSAGFSGSGGSL